MNLRDMMNAIIFENNNNVNLNQTLFNTAKITFLDHISQYDTSTEKSSNDSNN